jgi:diguanylate cyclase (GGDEF)-like protein/PAS domain S-box-containing protein
VDTPDGRFAGMVLATIAADSLNEFYCTFDVGREGSIGLLTLDGVVAARNPATSTTIGSSASKGILFRELLPKSTVGSFAENFPTDGVARFGSYQTVDGFPFVVVVAQGQQEALAAWRRDAANRLGISVAIASAFLLFAIGLARLIKRQQDAEKRYRLLADHSSDAIVCLNLDETRRYVSPAFTRLTGWTPAEGTCAAPGATIHSDDRAAVSQHLQAMATRSADEMTLRFRYICKNGSVLWVESRARFVAADGREPAQIIANVRDISQSMAAEQEIVALNRKLHELATIDGLTGLFNRRQFDEALLTEWRRALREDDVLSLVLLDVDRFKPYNDRYGHLQGDAALQAVAAVLRAIARRPGDVAARYGGEELALLLPGADADGADRLADMMRAGVEALALEHVDNAPARVVTVSLGVATFWPGAGGLELGPDALIIAADKALYQAKITGRNRVVRSPQPEAAHATSAGLFD